MYLSQSDFLAMFIAGLIVCFMTIMLLIANVMLKEKVRFLQSRLKHQRQECMLNHARVPF
jgi:hypothetical protein